MNPDLPSLLLPLGVVVPQRPDLETAWSRRDFQCDDDVANADGFAAQANADRLYALALEQALREMAGKLKEANRRPVDMRPSIGYVPWDIAINAGLTFAARPLSADMQHVIHRWLVAQIDGREHAATVSAPCPKCGGTRRISTYGNPGSMGYCESPCPACTGAKT
jgi:hypothetical protein